MKLTSVIILMISMQTMLSAQQPVKEEAQKSDKSSSQPSNSEKIDVLTDEIEKLKLGQSLFPSVKEKGKYGMGPAASKVYQIDSGVSLGGYGEIVYNRNNRQNESDVDVSLTQPDKVDLLRAILYVGYKFDSKWALNSEIEFEHGSEISVEFLYLDYLYSEKINFRIGHLLMPMGITNQLHEPPVYLGVFRTLSETYIIPGTWSEPGLGVFGSIKNFSYNLYAVNGLDGAGTSAAGGGAEGFSGATGFREGRSEGKEATARSFAGVARLDYLTLKGLTVGLSSYIGNSSQENSFTGTVWISDFHTEYIYQGFHLRFLASFAQVSNVTEIYQTKSSTTAFLPANSIGSQLYGSYLELGYDIFRLIKLNQEMMFFSRLEKIDTQYKMPSGFTKNDANDQLLFTIGLRYKPILNLSFKIDYQKIHTRASTGVDRVNFGLGYVF